MIVDEEVICPECGANLAIHCDFESERDRFRLALEEIAQWDERDVVGVGVHFQNIARSALFAFRAKGGES